MLDSFLPAGEISECRRARVVLKEIADALSKRSIGNACMSPSCGKCRPAVSRQTFARFLHHVGRLPDTPVFISHFMADAWRRDRLWEKAGQFGRVVEQFYGSGANADARYLVLSTKPLPNSTPMDRKEALKIVAEAIRKYPGEAHDFVSHRPFVFSRSWPAVDEQAHAEKRQKRPRKWEIDAKLTAALLKGALDTDGLVAILGHYGVLAEEENIVCKAGTKLYVNFRMPNDAQLRGKIQLAIELGDAETADMLFDLEHAEAEEMGRAWDEANVDNFAAAVFGHP